jgi:hypothetical protein
MNEQVIIESLGRIEKSAGEAAASAAQANTNVAVLTERVDNMIDRTNEHIAMDAKVHEKLEKALQRKDDEDKRRDEKIGDINTKHEKLTSKIAAWAAVLGGLAAGAFEVVKSVAEAVIR